MEITFFTAVEIRRLLDLSLLLCTLIVQEKPGFELAL